MPCPGEEDNKGIWKITEEERTSGKLAEVREGGDSTIRANKIPGHLGVGAEGQLIIDLSDPNPFPTIAVWAAVKFVHKKEHSAGGEIQHRFHPSSSLAESSTLQVLFLSRFAFLPLIADPDDSGKTDLFHHLSAQEAKLAAGPSHPGNSAPVYSSS